LKQPASFEWLHVEQRWRSAWDESPPCSGAPTGILEAPSFEEMCIRCLLDESPPLIREVGVPVALPKVDRKGHKQRIQKAQHRFPFDPSSRLGIVVLLKRHLEPATFDLVCGTSLIKALSGDAQRCADTYYLQKLCGAVCCLHVTTNFHSQEDAGHAAETLVCGSDSKMPQSYYCSSQVVIGKRRVLITSEVDGRNAQNDLVEIKTSGSKRGSGIISTSTVLQVACNGSGQILCCGLNKEKTHLQDLQMMSAAEAREQHHSSFIADGQRISLLLERVCSHELLDAQGPASDGVGPVLQLTFNEVKAPVLQPAPPNVRVLPWDLPHATDQ